MFQNFQQIFDQNACRKRQRVTYINDLIWHVPVLPILSMQAYNHRILDFWGSNNCVEKRCLSDRTINGHRKKTHLYCDVLADA